MSLNFCSSMIHWFFHSKKEKREKKIEKEIKLEIICINNYNIYILVLFQSPLSFDYVIICNVGIHIHLYHLHLLLHTPLISVPMIVTHHQSILIRERKRWWRLGGRSFRWMNHQLLWKIPNDFSFMVVTMQSIHFVGVVMVDVNKASKERPSIQGGGDVGGRTLHHKGRHIRDEVLKMMKSSVVGVKHDGLGWWWN